MSAPSRATWSPDGKHIAFNMFIKGKKTSFSTPVTQPEGVKWNDEVKVFDDITFRFDGAGYLPEGTNQVFRLSVEGGSPRQLTHGDADLNISAWLDNDTVLVTGNDADDRDMDFIESEIYAIELSDLSMTALTKRYGPDSGTIISPCVSH